MPKAIHLGVTGLRRTGKTVFLTSLIYQLTELGSRNLDAFTHRGIVLDAAKLFNPEGGAIERFPFARYLTSFRNNPPSFPPPTDREYGCILRFTFRNTNPPGMFQRVKRRVGLGKATGTIQLHLHDYPGEYLLDAMLARKQYTFQKWSQETLERMCVQCPRIAREYEETARQIGDQPSPEILVRLREIYGRYSLAAREAGLEFIQPAMTLLRWHTRRESERGSPDAPDAEELPFVPLPGCLAERDSLRQELQSRFIDHVQTEVKPFLKRIQGYRRQLVLVDVLRILRNGWAAYNDTRECITQIIRACHDVWKPFRGIKLTQFAATKADHATRGYRPNLTRLLDDLVFKARGNLKAGLTVPASEWFTSLRSAQDLTIKHEGLPLEVLVGTVLGPEGSQGPQTLHPGPVPPEWPDDPDWGLGNDLYRFPEFSPVRLPPRNGTLLPHLNLDRLLWNLLKDCF